MIHCIPNLVSQKQNVKLERMPSKEEIKQTVFDLNGDSACGPDGFSG